MNPSQFMTPAADIERPLATTLTRLRQLGVIPAIGLALDRHIDAVIGELHTAAIEEIPAFSASGNPDVVPEAASHAADHVREIRQLFDGRPVGDFGFVRSHAARRAEQKFPLEATLHAYRCGQRQLAHWLRDGVAETIEHDADDAIAAVADFAGEYTDTIVRIVAADYVARTRAIAEAEGDRRTELLSLLLSGYDEADSRIARLLRRAGYLEQRLSFCVAVAQPVDPSEMENPARGQRIVEAIAKAVADLPIKTLVGIRDDLVTAVFADTRRLSGWTAPQTALADRVRSGLLRLGPAVLVGLSADRPSTSHIPNALNEARMAHELASVTNRVVQFSELPLRRVLVHVGSDNIQHALPAWTEPLLELDRRSNGTVLETLQAYADADMNVQRAARLLDVHPNTIYARFERIEDATSLDPQNFHALTELLLAADLSDSEGT